MPSFMRNALVLSTTTAPAATAAGANSLLMLPPAEKNAILTSLKLSFVNSSTVYVLPANSTGLPALRALARSLRFLIGKLRSASTVRNSCPTAPVTPTIATLTDMTSTPHRKNVFHWSSEYHRVRIPRRHAHQLLGRQILAIAGDRLAQLDSGGAHLRAGRSRKLRKSRCKLPHQSV